MNSSFTSKLAAELHLDKIRWRNRGISKKWTFIRKNKKIVNGGVWDCMYKYVEKLIENKKKGEI